MRGLVARAGLVVLMACAPRAASAPQPIDPRAGYLVVGAYLADLYKLPLGASLPELTPEQVPAAVLIIARTPAPHLPPGFAPFDRRCNQYFRATTGYLIHYLVACDGRAVHDGEGMDFLDSAGRRLGPGLGFVPAGAYVLHPAI
jgi:hypothetical protein